MEDTKRTDLEFINKIYKYMKNDMPIESFMEKCLIIWQQYWYLL